MDGDIDLLLDSGQERRIHDVSLLELTHILALEQVSMGVLVQVKNNQAEDLSKVEASNHLLERLLTRARRLLVDDDVILSTRQNDVLIVESAPFAVDTHELIWRQLHVLELGDATAVLHVRGIAASTKNASDLHTRVGVGRGNEGTGGVID